MQANACRICKTADQLKPQFASDTGEKWVFCDGCGNIGTPTTGDPIEVWNKENPDE